jgi:hypothetical protein
LHHGRDLCAHADQTFWSFDARLDIGELETTQEQKVFQVRWRCHFAESIFPRRPLLHSTWSVRAQSICSVRVGTFA